MSQYIASGEGWLSSVTQTIRDAAAGGPGSGGALTQIAKDYQAKAQTIVADANARARAAASPTPTGPLPVKSMSMIYFGGLLILGGIFLVTQPKPRASRRRTTRRRRR